MRQHILVALIACCTSGSVCAVQGRSLVELGDGKSTAVRGRIESLDKNQVALMQQDGRIRLLPRQQLKVHRKIASRFEAFDRDEITEQLRREFGRGYRIVSSQHYVVVVPASSRTKYAQIFEDVFRAFSYQLRRRSYDLEEPEFPLVAIVFPDFREFATYARADDVRPTPTLRGYYHRLSNRVAVYEGTSTAAAAPAAVSGPVDALAGADDLTSTITHETIHQVAFNTGVHPRLGEPPRWLVEGLAMTFESPGFLATSSAARQGSRINRSRFVWFRNYQQRRPGKSLRAFLESDQPFRQQALDSYSQGWALTYFFMEQPSRSYKFANYVHDMMQRDWTKPYSPTERIRDFESAFGDIDRVEVEFLRFMERLDPNDVAAR